MFAMPTTTPEGIPTARETAAAATADVQASANVNVPGSPETNPKEEPGQPSEPVSNKSLHPNLEEVTKAVWQSGGKELGRVLQLSQTPRRSLAQPHVGQQAISRSRHRIMSAYTSARFADRGIFLELFAGRAQLTRSLAAFGFAAVNVDIAARTPIDLLDPCIQKFIESLISNRIVSGVWLAPPCTQWTDVTRPRMSTLPQELLGSVSP